MIVAWPATFKGTELTMGTPRNQQRGICGLYDVLLGVAT